MRRPLILNSGRSGSDRALHEADAPRLDYLEIAALIDAELSYPPETPGLIERLERHTVGVNVGQAWRARRGDPALFLTLSEQTGVPLAWLGPRATPHVLIAHNLTSRRRRAFQRWTRFLRRVDRVVVVSRAQERHLIEGARVPAEKVRFVYDKVDHRFFRPGGEADGGFVFSVGWEQRDYATLIEAIRPLDVPLVIVPSSAWVAGDGLGAGLPAQVEVRRDLTYGALRQLYDRASLVVVPIRPDVQYAAGVNALLEAMAMRKPVIVSRTPGLEGYLEDGRTGRWAPAGDPQALRELILALLSDRDEAARMASTARRLVEEGRNLDSYVSEVARVCLELVGCARVSPASG